MKKHFTLLFDRSHRWWTVSFLFLAVFFFILASILTITDNPPGIAALYCSVVCMFLTFIHPWRKPSNYAIMAGICAAIIIVIYVVIHIVASFTIEPGTTHAPSKGEGIIEAIMFITILFISVPGIVIGIVGALFWGIRGTKDDGRRTKDEE